MVTDELRILISVTGNAAAVNQVDRVHQSVVGLDNSVGKLAASLASLVSAGSILKFSKQCITAASDLQEVANVVNVTFGQNAAIINEWAKTQAKNFGLSEKAAKEYAGTFGTMANQFGFSLDEYTVMGERLAELTGDVASFYNITDKLAAIKLKSVFTGETETLKELGVVMTEANLNAYAMEKGLSKTLKQMTEHEKVALRYSFVMDKLSHAQGDFARTSDGWANSVRLLKLNFENLKIEIGNELLPVAGQGLAAINRGLNAISPVLLTVAQTVRLYGEAWKNASTVVKGYAKIAVEAVGVMLIAPKIISVISTAVEILTVKTLTLGTAIKGIAGLVGIIFTILAFKELNKEVQKLKEQEAETKFEDLAGGMSNASEAVKDLSDSVKDLGSSTKDMDLFLASFDEVNKVGGSNSLMSGLVTDDDITNILGAAAGIDDLQSAIDGLNTNVDINVETPDIPDISEDTFLDPKWWQRKWELIKGFFATLFNPSEFWKNWLIGAKEIWENWLIGAKEIVEALKKKFGNVIAFFEKVGSAAYDVIHPLVEAQLAIFDAVKTAIDEVITKIQELAHAYENSSIVKFFAGAGSNLYDLKHENDAEKDDTFTYKSKNGIEREALKYYPDGSETELYKKYKAMYNEDGTETELYRRMQVPDLPKAKTKTTPELPKEKSANTVTDNEYTRYNTGLFSGLIESMKSDLKKTIQDNLTNQSNIPNISNIAETTYNSYQQPSSSTVINNYAPQSAEKEKETVVEFEFNPTIQIDGKKITAAVLDEINRKTKSGNNAPIMQLGG